MARDRKRKPDEGPAGPGEWIVTFSDCMTLLLCFFVLLLTFSSFDEVELQKLAGAFQCDTMDTVFPVPREVKDCDLPPVPRVADMTQEGSEVPTEIRSGWVKNPAKPSLIVDDDAHRDRKVFFMPSEWLFWGKGSVLTGQGRNYLRKIGTFMAVVPSRVIIAEAGPDGTGRAVRLDRSLAVMRFFTQALELPAELFNITASTPETPSRMQGRRVVAVTLIPGRVY